jgi:hypothetical protein
MQLRHDPDLTRSREQLVEELVVWCEGIRDGAGTLHGKHHIEKGMRACQTRVDDTLQRRRVGDALGEGSGGRLLGGGRRAKA